MSTLQEQATIGGRDFTSHALVVQLSKQPCWIIHSGYPKDSTCLDVATYAEQNPVRYESKWHKRIINHYELCWPCAAKAALRRETLE